MTRRPGVVALADALRPWAAAIKVEYRREKALRASLKRERKLRGAAFREARERLRAQLWRGALWPFRPCPTPGIEAYRSHERAHVGAVAIMRYASRNSGRFTVAMPIKCRCGYWHIEVARGESEWEESE